MDVILDRGGRSSFKVCREYDLNCGDVTALSFSGDGNDVMACGLSGKAVVFGAKIGGMVRFDPANQPYALHSYPFEQTSTSSHSGGKTP